MKEHEIHELLQLHNYKMEGETISQIHVYFKEILNKLHGIGDSVGNQDLIRYVLNVFPHISLRSSIVDAYKVSKIFPR